MSGELTKTAILKRSSKKASGFTVSEDDGVYTLDAIPSKARANVGDRIARINGIGADEFVDKDDANTLMETISIVVVPVDKIEEYDKAMAAGAAAEEDESSDEEDDFEEVERGKKPSSMTCEHCNHENKTPEPDEDGDLVCENCGNVMEKKESESGDEEGEKADDESEKDDSGHESDESSEGPGGGQQFDEKGRAITNAKGKPLTPADMFKPGDIITVNVGKSNPKQDAGLKIEGKNGKYYVRKVPAGGLFSKTPVIAGDKILELNDVDSQDYKDANQMKIILRDEQSITIVVLRTDPDASESSADSIIEDDLEPVKPDDDTAPLDGEEQCGCNWCPQCYELDECKIAD
mmetsp:Transcript_16995/g.34954  ORF Transcript_16995/g.34954 Transcript_16995/m.34954 type:complete len:349 (-) Transcript_16995:249-1295(-)|eukprot:CAMPEP_0201116802 /NCGR_PEP_ID=MMETSP0850-20130426/976_1 /ASSEMBLY_ACC=CAM_ASM_000622 /TAXON_ID=183588 /ORGANISM="Pseudo-nitzschia fraudulenta, Strain WWA7" /LENGTH=348 /DNA_ID=CAMNT_0047380983 /DNA_START=118 /DNA_END=1164 /DNA_ORIENTATION=+